MVNVRIRGIYSTALTRLLLDNGFKVVQPSASVRERFNFPKNLEDDLPPDLDIYDRLDRQGVNAVGGVGSVEALASILLSTLDDVVIRRRFSIFAETHYPDHQTNLEITPHDFLRETESSGSSRRIRLNVEFPGSSKKKLDYIRGLITPTLDDHHYYKACGGRISSLLDMAERMLENNCPPKEVENLFKETVEREYPDEGSRISIEHVKIDGKTFHLGEAQIRKIDEENRLVRLSRTFHREGIYDGLKTRKDPGDYAVTDMKIGEWSFRTRYFSKEGIYKGTYVNLNTPIEMYPAKIRYIDLEVDVCLWPGGKIQRIDQEKLYKMISEGCVSEKLGQIVEEKIGEILNSLSLDAQKNKLSDN